MASNEVDPGLRRQGDESGENGHRPENDLHGAIAVRCLEVATHMAIAQQTLPLFRHRMFNAIRDAL